MEPQKTSKEPKMLEKKHNCGWNNFHDFKIFYKLLSLGTHGIGIIKRLIEQNRGPQWAYRFIVSWSRLTLARTHGSMEKTFSLINGVDMMWGELSLMQKK